MNSPLTQTVQAPSRFSALADGGLGRERLSRWSRVVILGTLSCLLIPRGVELQLGTIMINIPRILLTLFSLMAMNQLLSGTIVLRMTLADVLMSIHVAIIAFSSLYHEGFGEGLETAVAVLVDMGMTYFVARVAVCNLTSYRYYVRVTLIIAAISAAFGLIETFTGFSPINAAYHTFFPKVIDVNLTEKRISLYRAITTFRVEQLFGLYCMTAFAIAACVKPYNLNMGGGIRKICLALCILGVFASLSSGPWIALGLCFACLAYDHIARNIRDKWKILLLACGSVLLFLSVASNRGPFKIAIDYLTLDRQTGYVRLAMWECVWALMRDYWPLGWGWSGNWPRSVDWYIWSSVDSFFAVYLVRSGIFAVLSIVGFFTYCWYKLSYFNERKYVSASEAKGWVIGTVCFFITAVTVDIFGNLIFATYFLLGAGQTLFTTRELTLCNERLPQTIGVV